MLFSGKSRNRNRTKIARAATVAGLAGASIAIPLMSASGAQAASVETWDKVAMCESSGNWQNADTGNNGHYGGLQFSPSSWALAGGTQYAPRADMATKEQQIATAERLLAMQGPGAWECAHAGPLTAGGPKADVNPGGSAPQAKQVALHAEPVAAQHKATAEQLQAVSHKDAPAGDRGADHRQGGDVYTVVTGDTLAKIAEAHDVDGGWVKLFKINKDLVKSANLIHPGQQLNLS